MGRSCWLPMMRTWSPWWIAPCNRLTRVQVDLDLWSTRLTIHNVDATAGIDADQIACLA